MRNLLGRLLDRSPNELDRIASFWDVEISGRDRFADVAALYRTMTDIWAAREVWFSLSPDEQRLIDYLRERDEQSVHPSELAAEVGSDPDQTRDQLRGLYVAGIVAVDDENLGDIEREPPLFLPREMALIFERVSRECDEHLDREAPLDALLALSPSAELEEAAVRWGANIAPGVHPRSEIINIVRDQLTNPDRVRRYIENLSLPARRTWEAIVQAEGALPIEAVPPDEDVRPARRRGVIRDLAAPLLVWHQVKISESGEIERNLVIPEAILHPPQPKPEPLPDLSTYEPDDVFETEWIFPQSATWDLITVLREVVVRQPRWNALIDPDPAIIRRLSGRLWLSDRESGDIPTGYVPFLVRIGALMGLLREDESRAMIGQRVRNWRRGAFTTAQRELVRAWISAEEWIEGEDRLDLTLYGASWPAFRATLLRALGELDPDLWYDQESFVDRLLRAEPDLLRQAQIGAVASSQLSMRLQQQDSVEDRRAEVLRLITGTTIETALQWLNMIERSHHLESGRAAFRLTPFGHWIVGPRSEPVSQQLGPAAIGVGGNFDILLYRPNPSRVWSLLTFTELKTLDRVSTFTLTASALIRALSAGLDLDEILRFLHSSSNGQVPQAVIYTLEEWDRGYRRIWLRRSVVLVPEEGEDSQKIAEALEDAGLEPEVLPDGRLLLLYDEPDAGERLYGAATRALRDRGFAPLGSEDRRRRR